MAELQIDPSSLPVQIRAKLAELDTELSEGRVVLVVSPE